MSADLEDVQAWAAGLLARLSPSERKKVNRAIAAELRRDQSQRITAQKDPDGMPYARRKPRKNLRGKKGHIKRKMFARLKTAKHLRIQATSDEALVGFTGRAGRVAKVHQQGLRDRAAPGAPDVRYPVRRLLGFNDDNRARILDALAAHLAGVGM
ncbi:Phage virion morphogenesis family protein [compost metagenome]